MTIDTQKLRDLYRQAGAPTLYIRTNRHPETDGRPWGWVSEHPPGGHNTTLDLHWTWGERSDFRAQMLVRVVNTLPDLLDNIDAQAEQLAAKDAEIALMRGASMLLADWCEHEVDADPELTPGLAEIRAALSGESK